MKHFLAGFTYESFEVSQGFEYRVRSVFPCLCTQVLIIVHSSLEMWYLHGPDRSVPYEVTLKAVNDLYKEGYFKRFGLSNYMS